MPVNIHFNILFSIFYMNLMIQHCSVTILRQSCVEDLRFYPFFIEETGLKIGLW